MFLRVSCTCYAIMLTAVIMIQGRDGANKKTGGLHKIITIHGTDFHKLGIVHNQKEWCSSW